MSINQFTEQPPALSERQISPQILLAEAFADIFPDWFGFQQDNWTGGSGSAAQRTN